LQGVASPGYGPVLKMVVLTMGLMLKYKERIKIKNIFLNVNRRVHFTVTVLSVYC